jgi:hypothetical protein
MDYSEKLKDVAARLIGDRTLRDVAAEIGCDHTLLYHMQRYGKVPRRDSIIRIANGLKLTGEAREELFAAAGYIEFAEDAAAGAIA